MLEPNLQISSYFTCVSFCWSQKCRYVYVLLVFMNAGTKRVDVFMFYLCFWMLEPNVFIIDVFYLLLDAGTKSVDVSYVLLVFLDAGTKRVHIWCVFFVAGCWNQEC